MSDGMTEMVYDLQAEYDRLEAKRIKSDGSTASYYELPANATELRSEEHTSELQSH